MKFKFQFKPITLKRWSRFRRIRRGYFCFWLFIVLVSFSCFSEFIANSRAIFVSYQGSWYFPTFSYFPESRFGGEGEGEANYRKLKERLSAEGTGFVLLPLLPYNAFEYDFSEGPPPHPPSSKHWLGTDDRGRDVLVRLLYGFRISVFFAIFLTIFSQVIGASIGAIMGYFGGRVDIYAQRFIEIWSNMPYLYVVIIIASIFIPNFWTLLLIMAIFGWVGITYYIRTEVYREKSKEYCLAARSCGGGHLRVIFKHLIPNSLVPVITLFPFQMISSITALTALDFLGYGLPPPTPSWGEMMDQALKPENLDRLWLSLSPFTALFFTLLIVTFIGEAVREAFDPKEYAHYR